MSGDRTDDAKNGRRALGKFAESSDPIHLRELGLG